MYKAQDEVRSLQQLDSASNADAVAELTLGAGRLEGISEAMTLEARRADNPELGLIITQYSQVIADLALSLRMTAQAIESGEMNWMLKSTEIWNDADKMWTETRSLLIAWELDNL